MTDPRTQRIILYDLLSQRLHDEMEARDQAWADYWQRRRVVVVPDDKSLENVGSLPHLRAAEPVPDSDEKEWAGKNAFNWFEDGAESVIHDCITRLKAAREKDAVNKNLSTLLAVVVKVQRDLEVLLNGSTPR